jgi:outer membrane protein TolC
VGGAAGSLLTGSPVGLLSSSVISDVLSQTMPSTRPVSDADMVILAKAVDSLQKQLLTHYYAYLFSQQQLALGQQTQQRLQQHYQQAQQQAKVGVVGQPPEQAQQQQALMVVMGHLLSQHQYQLQQTATQVNQHRTELALLVGQEALTTMENVVK